MTERLCDGHWLAGLSGPVRVLLRPPLVGRVDVQIAALQARPVVRSVVSERARVVLHCRSPLGAYMGLLLRDSCGNGRLRVVADFRGVVANELELARGLRQDLGVTRGLLSTALGERRARAVRRIEAEVCARADGFSCVSEALRDRLVDAYGLPTDRSIVVPTCVSFPSIDADELIEKRREAKAKLGLTENYVVAYSGSMAPWQEPGDTVEAFQACRRARPDAHLLVLTTSPTAAQSRLSAAGLATGLYTILSVPHDQVQSHLVAADVGLLLRRPSPINAVASPIKFAEYVASGVPVLASAGIGDLDGLVPTFGLGRIIGDPREAEDAVSGLALNEEGAATVLRDYYSWSAATSGLRVLYGRVFGVKSEAPA